MEPINFEQVNFTFTKPEGMTDEECGSLPVFRGEGVIISKWINKATGKFVFATIYGNGMPPISISESNPLNPEECSSQEDLLFEIEQLERAKAQVDRGIDLQAERITLLENIIKANSWTLPQDKS